MNRNAVHDWRRNHPGPPHWTTAEWKQHFVHLSKTLSYYLRHGARDAGMTIGTDGYLAVADLLHQDGFERHGHTEEEIVMLVENSTKQRFACKNQAGALLIRAQQGHSEGVGDVDYNLFTTSLDSSTMPDNVIHGTCWLNMKAILTEGLKNMRRDHIHLADDINTTTGIGQRSDTILKINCKRALADGMKFLRSGNGVILTEGFSGVIPPRYIERVMDRNRVTVPPWRLPVPLSVPKALETPLPKKMPRSAHTASSSSAYRERSRSRRK